MYSIPYIYVCKHYIFEDIFSMAEAATGRRTGRKNADCWPG